MLILWLYLESVGAYYRNVGWEVAEVNTGGQINLVIPEGMSTGALRFQDGLFEVELKDGRKFSHPVTENLRRMAAGTASIVSDGTLRFELDGPLNPGSFPIPGYSDKATTDEMKKRFGTNAAVLAEYSKEFKSARLTFRFKFGAMPELGEE